MRTKSIQLLAVFLSPLILLLFQNCGQDFESIDFTKNLEEAEETLASLKTEEPNESAPTEISDQTESRNGSDNSGSVDSRPSNPSSPVPSQPVAASNLAFPGAEGFGRETIGGRGGEVLRVTNLQDSGVGSLRWALEQNSQPRFAVFEVSGNINLSRYININSGRVTVAGHTAPFPGITLRGAGIYIGSSQVIIRGLKIRTGDGVGQNPTDRDSISMGTRHRISNIVVDSNSLTWAVDETLTAWFRVSRMTV